MKALSDWIDKALCAEDEQPTAWLSYDIEDIQFVFFRSVRFIMATLLLNFIYLKKINFIDELHSVLYWITIHGLINFVVVILFFQYFTKIPETNTFSFLLFFVFYFYLFFILFINTNSNSDENNIKHYSNDEGILSLSLLA